MIPASADPCDADTGDLFSLHGRRAPVTGSGEGLGLTLARGLSAAGAAVFLAARASDFVNGQLLFVDGGRLAAL